MLDFIKSKKYIIIDSMLFQKPEVDVERHAEMRMRRVFPVSLEGSIKASYEEALKKLKEATELERQAYQLTMERAILEHRLSIWDWLGKNFDQLSRALTSGSYEDAKSLIEQIRQEAQRRYQEEQQLLKQVQSGQSVSASIKTPVFTGSSGGSYVSSKAVSQPTQPSGSLQTQPSGSSQQPPLPIVLSYLEGLSKRTGQTYIVSAKEYGATGGYYVVTPQGGMSTASPEKVLNQTYQPLFFSPGSPANVPAFNPFQQSGFYNPFR
jgi:hypothetical protein